MAKGKKTGGRRAGKPNRDTGPVVHILTRLGGPDGEQYAQQLYDLACLPHDNPMVRIKALSVIAPYVWGKPPETLKLTGADGHGPAIVEHRHVMVGA